MGNGHWVMGNGQWAMGNGHWAMGIDEEPMTNDQFPILRLRSVQVPNAQFLMTNDQPTYLYLV
jgi:hypothetical protein